MRTITQDESFTKSTVTGLVVWQGPDVTVARVGPRTLAVGSLGEVDTLVQVRLGTEPDLKIDDPLLERFQELDPDSALRLVSRTPGDLATVFGPILPAEFLEEAELLGLEMTLTDPGQGAFDRQGKRCGQGQRAGPPACKTNRPAGWPFQIRISSSRLKRPKVEQKNENLDLHFDIPEGAARLLLQRLAKVQSPVAAVIVIRRGRRVDGEFLSQIGDLSAWRSCQTFGPSRALGDRVKKLCSFRRPTLHLRLPYVLRGGRGAALRQSRRYQVGRSDDRGRAALRHPA